MNKILIKQEVHCWTTNGIQWLNGQARTSPHLMNRVCNKETNEQMQGRYTESGSQHFLHFPQCFPSFSKRLSIFQSLLICCPQMPSIETSLRTCDLVKSLVMFSDMDRVEPNLFLSHNNPCFQCNIAIINFLVSYMCKIRLNDIIGQSSVHN